MKSPVLSIRNLEKSYGRRRAVRGISLTVEEGMTYGLLGPNGSGKSTTLGMLLGTLKADGGSFQWFGKDGHEGIKGKVGALLEGPNFYPNLSAADNLKINCLIKRVPFTEIDRVLQIVGLKERATSKFKTFSTGMKMRLAIANTLLGDPQVLVLDEPTNGLDPQGIVEVRELIRMLSAKGKTIVLASHLLDEVERVCTHVAVMRLGEVLYEGPADSLTDGGKVIRIASADMVTLREVVKSHPNIESVREEDGFLLVQVQEDIQPEELNSFLHSRGITLSHLALQRKSLETQFLELTSNQKS